MSEPLRFYVEGDGSGSRIYDREWGQSGYIVKVWARKENDPGGFRLTDIGPEVRAQAESLCAMLNEHEVERARAERAEKELAALRAENEQRERGNG